MFDMEYILMEDHVKFVSYKLKGKAVIWWNQLQKYLYVLRQTTCDNVETDEMTFTST